MSKQQLFLIRADDEREAVMRLPVNRYGGITQKAFDAIHRRFYDGASNTHHNMRYALNLEAFSNGRNLVEAIEKYYRNEI
jgi:hypothetical protein